MRKKNKLRSLGKFQRDLGIAEFAYVALGWLPVGAGLSWILTPNPDEKTLALGGMGLLWFLSILDLAVLSKLGLVLFSLVNAEGARRSALTTQAFLWGAFKIICLGLFVITLLKGQKIPMSGLSLGMGTLVVVPLLGGFLWSRKVLTDA